MPTRIPRGAMVDIAKMAVRHDVSNLARRGNILYWRARVPRSICKSPDGQRISVSLRLSDHVKAARIARRLNLVMAEAEFDRWHLGMSKEQIAQFFQAEVEKIRAELDDVAVVARRTGVPDIAREVEADVEVGWAYRLLEKWGTARELSFDVGCPARTELQAAGLSEDAMARIAETYRSERKGSHRGVFEDRLAETMKTFGIADTPANRERAKTAFFKAQADTLLDYQDRYPDFVPEAATTRETTASVPVGGGIHNPVGTSNNLANSSDGVRVEARPSKPEVWASSDQPPGSPDGGQAPRQNDLPPPERVLPVNQFEAEAERVVRNRRDEWTPDTAVDFRVLVRTFASILTEHGVRNSGEIRQQHIAALRQHYNDIPTRYGQSARLRDLSTAALRAEAQRMVKRAVLTGEKLPQIGLSGPTVRRHLGNLDLFLKHLRAAGYPVRDWTFESLRPKKKKPGEIRLAQVKPSPDQIRPIFDLPIFTGCLGPEDPGRAGRQVFHSSLYFLPMFFAYLGARRIELAGLATNDVVTTPHGPALHIRTNDIRRIKNAQSDRLLPVPDDVLRLGFMDYVEAIKMLGDKRLFPELYSPNQQNPDPGDRFYKDFVPVLEASPAFADGIWNRALHALRHGLADTLKQSGVQLGIIDDISGRLSGGETQMRYTNPAGQPLIRDALRHYPVVTGHLEPHSIRLLPWVQERRPAPWVGRKPADRFRK